MPTTNIERVQKWMWVPTINPPSTHTHTHLHTCSFFSLWKMWQSFAQNFSRTSMVCVCVCAFFLITCLRFFIHAFARIALLWNLEKQKQKIKLERKIEANIYLYDLRIKKNRKRFSFCWRRPRSIHSVCWQCWWWKFSIFFYLIA